MPERSTMLFGLTVVGLSVSLSAIVALTLQPAPSTTSLVPLRPDDTARLDDLHQRLLALESDAHTLRPEPASQARGADPAENRQEVTPSITAQLDGIQDRLERLEQRGSSGVDPVLREITLIDEASSRFLRRSAALQVIHSDQSTTEQILEAHQSCRRIPNAYDEATAQKVIDIGLNDPNPETRAKIWTSFDGAAGKSLTNLVPPLLQAVASDQSATVRAEAAETLGNFPDSPYAIAALEMAAQRDPDGHVRRKAQRTLEEIRSER